MKKVGIFLGSEVGAGGLFQYSLAMLEAVAALAQDRFQVIAAYFNPDWRPYIENLGLAPLALHASGREPAGPAKIWRQLCLPIGPWRNALSRSDPTARLLSRQDCEFWFFPAQDHWSYLATVKAVVTIHDLMHRYQPQFPEVSRWGRAFLRDYRFSNICRTAKVVLVDSEVGVEQVAESYGLPRQRIYPLPYLPPDYIFNTQVPADFDVRYPLPKKFLWYPAQFWEHKNHPRLLRALAQAKRSYPDVALVLAGPARHRFANIVRLTNELGLAEQVHFVGYVPDAYMAEFYRRAHALIMPTFFGPTNIPPLEAFVCGCAVGCSNLYGMPEQVGDAALLFDPRSETQIADVIERLWIDEQLRSRLIANGYERSARWGRNEFRNKLEEILQRASML